MSGAYSHGEKIKKPCKFGCSTDIYVQNIGEENGRDKWLAFDFQTGQIHECPNRVSPFNLTACRKCGKKITFDRGRVSSSGKLIPLDGSDLSIHQCPVPVRCRYCESDIIFDPSNLSPTGKTIPLNAADSSPHKCQGKLPNSDGLDYV